jgi:hypothetical protein
MCRRSHRAARSVPRPSRTRERPRSDSNRVSSADRPGPRHPGPTRQWQGTTLKARVSASYIAWWQGHEHTIIRLGMAPVGVGHENEVTTDTLEPDDAGTSPIGDAAESRFAYGPDPSYADDEAAVASADSDADEDEDARRGWHTVTGAAGPAPAWPSGTVPGRRGRRVARTSPRAGGASYAEDGLRRPAWTDQHFRV